MGDWFYNYFKELCKFCKDWFVRAINNRRKCPEFEKASEEEIKKEKDWRHSGCNITAPKVYKRPTYSIDTLSVDEKKILEGSCDKNFAQFPGLTGGVFIPRCALHEFALGWTTQPYSEKYDDAFAFFMTRDWYPKTIICDYCCIFNSYCINREPERFKKTSVYGDTFHWKKGHKCSKCFNFAEYRLNNPDLKHVNASSNEQHNSGIDKMKLSSRYMRLKLFSRMLNLSLEVTNRRMHNNMPKN